MELGTLPATVGPWAAGLIMDNINPNWVWYVAGILCAVSVVGFCMLHLKTRESLASEPAPRLIASNT
jgi:predicted MFS family arabinose efflux permease